jgi:hypothetical protein
MNNSMATLSGQLSTIALMTAQFMATPGLVPVFGLHIDSDPHDYAVMNVLGLLDDFDLDEAARIDAIRGWAMAMNGRLNLGEPRPAYQSTNTFRRLSAIADLPGGGRFEVFTLIARASINARLTTAGDLVAA